METRAIAKYHPTSTGKQIIFYTLVQMTWIFC